MICEPRKKSIMNIRGRSAIVTGGGGAIGGAIVDLLASCEIHVYSIDRQFSQPPASDLVTRHVCDVSDAVEFKTLLQQIQEEREIDILVNCVGVSPKRRLDGELISLSNVTLEEWNALMNVNLNSYLVSIQGVMPQMMRRKAGRIINVGSHVARNGGNTGAPHYITSKAAVVGLTKAAAKEAASCNVTVNVVHPGRIDTPMTRDQPAHVEAEILRLIPLGRLGRPHDVAGAVLFLASDLADYITAAAIDVNGGGYIAP